MSNQATIVRQDDSRERLQRVRMADTIRNRCDMLPTDWGNSRRVRQVALHLMAIMFDNPALSQRDSELKHLSRMQLTLVSQST